jgi:hypothetical protein
MERYATRRFVLSVGAVGLLIGMLLGAALVAGAPADAGTGDAVILGKANSAEDPTKIKGSGRSTLRIINEAGGIPLVLVSEDGQPPLKVDSSARVARLNADKVDGWHAHALAPRVSAAGPVRAGRLCDGSNCSAELLEVTVEAPRDGILIIGAAIDLARYSDGEDAVICRVQVDEFFTAVGGRMGVLVGADGAAGNYEEDCSINAWEQVEAGTHTVTLQVIGVRDKKTIVGSGGALWALWAPIDASTGQTFDR